MVNYSVNVLRSIEFSGYKDYIAGKTVFIGDFNTPTKKDKRLEYEKIINTGLIDCANKNDILKPTYSHSEEINYFTADYCFATEQMVKTYKITE